jgi:hypothetical protein
LAELRALAGAGQAPGPVAGRSAVVEAGGETATPLG